MRRESGFIFSLILWMIFLPVSVVTVLTAAAFLLVPGKSGPHIAHWLQLRWCRVVLKIFGIRLEVVHPERIVRDRPVIYFSNHQSFVDIMIIGATLRTQYRWLAKAELFNIPVLGWGMRRTGYIPVERGSSTKATQSFFRAADRIRAGESIVVFPEATVTPDGGLLPFKNGGFVIARRAEVTVQPLSISGAFEVMPDQEHRRIARVTPGPVRVFVHEPIEVDTYGDLDPAEFKQRVRERIESELKREPVPVG